MRLTKEARMRVAERILRQEGQSYACGNQLVTCAIVGEREDWDRFVKLVEDEIAVLSRDSVKLRNGERWQFISMNAGEWIRGYRFYKIKVRKDIDRDKFLEAIMPCCSFYCKEIVWL